MHPLTSDGLCERGGASAGALLRATVWLQPRLRVCGRRSSEPPFQRGLRALSGLSLGKKGRDIEPSRGG